MTERKANLAAPDAASGDNHNNMSPLNPHANQTEPAFWCGNDWLKLNFQIKFLEWEKFHEILDTFAMAAMEARKPVLTNDMSGAEMMPGGGSIGKGSGKKGKYCKYRMSMPFGSILIAEGESYAGTWPNVQINIPGEVCLTYPGGADEAYNDAIQWLESLSAQIDKELVSRVDFCADFPGWDMQHFVAAYLGRKWKCRAKTQQFVQSNAVSLYFGTAPLMLRIYDKLAEMEASALRGEPIKFEHMIQKRWGGVRPENAIRVEYQVSREKLKEWGIDTYADLKTKGGAVLGYLTGARDNPMFDVDAKKMKVMRWFRFLLKRRDPKHPERERPSKRWKIVQQTFIERYGLPEPLTKVAPDDSDVEALAKQAFGVLEAAAWNKGYAIPDRPITPDTKYHFKDYMEFQHWFFGMLRNVALDKPGWCLQYEKYDETAVGLSMKWMSERDKLKQLKKQKAEIEQEIKYLTEGEQ